MSSRLKLESLKQTREYNRNVHLLGPIVEVLESLLPPEPATAEVLGAFAVAQETVVQETVVQEVAAPPQKTNYGQLARQAEERSKKRISRKEGLAEARARTRSVASDPVTPEPSRISNVSPGTVEALREAAQSPEPRQFRINLYV